MAVPQKPGGGFNRPPGQADFKNPAVADLTTRRRFNRGRFAPRKEAEHRINHFIRVPQVRLVGDNVEVGIYSTQDALTYGAGSAAGPGRNFTPGRSSGLQDH